jgi:regulator of sigma E protease
MFTSTLNIILLVVGFGFVIFWHELGHFLAAKWCGVRVEQFAVGFGQAICSWRKGLGLRLGSTNKEYERLMQERGEAAEGAAPPAGAATAAPEIGETEYRLNWIPLGGYVKMRGQDDLKPNATSDNPRAYNRQSIGKRMIIVSAGVVMNIILAAIGFMVIFMMGFNAPPAVVGGIVPGSPAQYTVNEAGQIDPLQVGDRILMFDGKWQHDFTKISLNAALVKEGQRVPLYVQRRDGSKERLYITPRRSTPSAKSFLMLGIEQPRELRGIDVKEAPEEFNDPAKLKQMLPADVLDVKPGDLITQVNGQDVKLGQYYLLDEAIQKSEGNPVRITVKGTDGKTRQEAIRPHFDRLFGERPLTFGGMAPRTAVATIDPASSALGKLLPGDVILKIMDKDATVSNPDTNTLIKKLNQAGQQGIAVSMLIERDGKQLTIPDLKPDRRLGRDDEGNVRYGLGIGLGYDERHPVVASVAGRTGEKTPAEEAGIPVGAKLTRVAGQPVESWFDVQRLFATAKPDQSIAVSAVVDGAPHEYSLVLTHPEIASIGDYRLGVNLQLHDRIEPRKAPNPLVAAGWGVTETRDFVLQFYVTIQRMFQGSVSYQNMMGPVGIFTAGTKFAYKGMDWLIWFLAMISANLAVVNFLPIPIVDGGLFTFLLIEKLQGRPLSARTQSIAQIVGLALILGVFLLVTYQDIARLSFMGH